MARKTKSKGRVGLRRRRQAAGWTQERLATLIGIDRATLSRWEAGKRAPHSVFKNLWVSAVEFAEANKHTGEAA